MHGDAELFDLHFYTWYGLKTIRQLLSQTGQRLSQSSGDRMTEGHPRPVDLKSSTTDIDNTRHANVVFEIVRISSRADDDSRVGCCRQGYQSATDQQRQPDAGSIPHAWAEQAVKAREEKQSRP